MGNPLRNASPDVYHHITVRTANRAMWWLPKSEYNELFGGVLARYQEMYGIEIFAYIFLTNHYHLLVRAPKSNLHEFFRDVNREISRRVNYLVDREGAMYSRRYTDQECIRWSQWDKDDPGDRVTGIELSGTDDTVACLLYILTNPTHHRLLFDSRKWPGLTAFEQVLDEKDRKYQFKHYSRKGEPDWITEHRLKITPLPYFQAMSQKRRREMLEKLLEHRHRCVREERKEAGKSGYMGLMNIRKLTQGDIPQPVEKSPRIPCYSMCKEAIREFMEEHGLIRDRYAIASRFYRGGEPQRADFPEYTIPPPVHCDTREKPFSPTRCYTQIFKH